MRREQAAPRERRSRIQPHTLACGLDCLARPPLTKMVLTPALRRELLPRLGHRRRHARRCPLGVPINGIRKRLLHADVAREDQARAHAVARWCLVHVAHEILIRAQVARQRAHLRQIGHHVRLKTGVEQRRRQ
jgi:hypothetical protein